MYRKQLQQTFRWKISAELKIFHCRMMKCEKETIYMYAYRIDHMICIYETLMELSERMPEKELENCIRINGLLDFLYGEWLKVPDSQNEELEHTLWSLLEGIGTQAA